MGHRLLRELRARALRVSYPRRIATTRAEGRLTLPQVELAAAAALPPELREAAERIRAEADEVVAHRVDLLGSGMVDLGDEIDWQRDFKSGYRWPEAYYADVEITRLDDGSDAKVPWELSRAHHLLTLARAARLYDDDGYADELERQLRDWIRANPVGIGINWTNAMEVGIRAANWVWAAGTLDGWRPLAADLRAELADSLAAHAAHIRANLEESPLLRSNHYLGDILGLLVVGACLRDGAQGRAWFEYAHENFEREINSQALADGVGFEASLAYHGLVLEMFVLARRIARFAGVPFSAAYDEQLERMLAVSRAARHPGGRLPQFGDNDSGRILPAGFARPLTHDHVVWLGAAELDVARPLAGPVHEEVAWTFGLVEWERAAALPDADEPPRAFPDGGLYVLGDEGLHLVARCGDVGQNGNGGHAHNDALSFELSCGGRPLVVDPGTYAYTSDPDARNAFRATAAHNTVRVDGREIHPIDPAWLFSLMPWARVQVERFSADDGPHELVAGHDGFRARGQAIYHRRRFSLDPLRAEVRIEDELDGSGTHLVESFVHLSAQVVPACSGEDIDLLVGEDRVATIAGSDTTSFEIEEGWVSDGFGVRERAAVLVARRTATLPARMAYSIAMAKVPRASTPPALSGA
jgi:uncharacterized heparinase superfamily protein